MAKSERRSYNQFCAVARALDVVGERWTMLLVRDLLNGPKRYKDLANDLPGIGTNLLAQRLQELEAAGLLEKATLPPPAGSTVYRLTDRGRELQEVVFALGRWGAKLMDKPRSGDRLLPGTFFVAMRAKFQAEHASGMNETFEVRVDQRIFEVRVADGRCDISEGTASRADAIITTDVKTLAMLLSQRLAPAEALAAGRVVVDGDRNALPRFLRVFGRWQLGDVDTHLRGASRAGAARR